MNSVFVNAHLSEFVRDALRGCDARPTSQASVYAPTDPGLDTHSIAMRSIG